MRTFALIVILSLSACQNYPKELKEAIKRNPELKRILLIFLVLGLCSCSDVTIVKRSNGTYAMHAGSFASKADQDDLKITLADGTTVERHINKKDEVSAVDTVGKVVLTGKLINGVESAATDGISKIGN